MIRIATLFELPQSGKHSESANLLRKLLLPHICWVPKPKCDSCKHDHICPWNFYHIYEEWPGGWESPGQYYEKIHLVVGECSPMEMVRIYHQLMYNLWTKYEYIVNVSKQAQNRHAEIVKSAQCIKIIKSHILCFDTKNGRIMPLFGSNKRFCIITVRKGPGR